MGHVKVENFQTITYKLTFVEGYTTMKYISCKYWWCLL